MTGDEEPPGFELVMPFVVCTSQQGPYEDVSFTAGWEAGWLSAVLPVVAGTGATVVRWVLPELVPQVDLIAMKAGYTCTAEPWEDNPDAYVKVTLSPSAGSCTCD